MKLRLSFLLLGLLVAFSSFAKVDCARALQGSEALYRAGAKDLFLTFRENAPHYWKWMGENAEKNLGRELLTEGIVVGDAHLQNFGHVRLTPSSKFQVNVIDLDDSGRGPLILDLIRLHVGIQLSPVQLKTEKIWEAYRKGLKKETFPLPKFIQEANGITSEEFKRNQERWMDKKTKNGRFHPQEIDGFQEFRDAPRWLEESYQELTRQMNVKIQDAGWINRAQGGSRGMTRIWILTDQNSIFEFKQMAEPATGNFTKQLQNSNRLQEVKSTYWGAVPAEQSSVFHTTHADFLFRQKFDYELNDKIKDLLKSKSEQLDKYAEYLAYRLGELHSAQTAGKNLSKVIEQSPKEISEKIKKLSTEYQAQLEKLFQNKGSIK